MAVIDNLVAYWSMDEASGNAIDAHAAHDGTETSGTIASTTGKVGNARDFEASADTEYFEVADHADLRGGDKDFSIAGWINCETTPTGGTLVAKGVGTANASASEYSITLTSGDLIQFSVRRADDVSANNETSSTFGTLSTATWYFVVAWHDSINNLLGVSVNDVADTVAHTTGVFAGTNPLFIGAAGGPAGYFDGLIDELGYWNKVLSAAEITWLYNSGNGRSYADIVAEGSGRATKNTRAFPLGLEVGMNIRGAL